MADLLSSVSSFGWYTSAGSTTTDLLAVGSFGWWFESDVVVERPEIYCIAVRLHRTHAVEVC
jgi:hypothetical protein